MRSVRPGEIYVIAVAEVRRISPIRCKWSCFSMKINIASPLVSPVAHLGSSVSAEASITRHVQFPQRRSYTGTHTREKQFTAGH